MKRVSLYGLLTVIACCPAISAQGLPAGNAKSIVETACTTCHPVTLITSAGHTPAEWKLLVERMVSAGADVPKDKIPAELYETFKGVDDNARRDHTLTGPIYVTGAAPGDSLEIRLRSALSCSTSTRTLRRDSSMARTSATFDSSPTPREARRSRTRSGCSRMSLTSSIGAL